MKKKPIRDEHGNVIGQDTIVGVASTGRMSKQGAVVTRETSKSLDALVIPGPVTVGNKIRDARRTNTPLHRLRYTLIDDERFVSLDDVTAALKEAGYTDVAEALRRGFR